MAVISLNLGLLNLMPVPVLDGGHILIMALEGVARRDFSMAVKEKMLLAGFVVLMMLMVTVIYNDLTRITLDRAIDAVAQLERHIRVSTASPVRCSGRIRGGFHDVDISNGGSAGTGGRPGPAVPPRRPRASPTPTSRSCRTTCIWPSATSTS